MIIKVIIKTIFYLLVGLRDAAKMQNEKENYVVKSHEVKVKQAQLKA